MRRYGLRLGGLYSTGAAIRGAAVAVIDDAGEATFMIVSGGEDTCGWRDRPPGGRMDGAIRG